MQDSISRQFYNAAVDEYHRVVGEIDKKRGHAVDELLFSKAKLEILQEWISAGKNLQDLNVGAYECKFNF